MGGKRRLADQEKSRAWCRPLKGSSENLPTHDSRPHASISEWILMNYMQHFNLHVVYFND
jgi:hypothetical protein